MHSVDVDNDGVAWVSGEGGVRGYWTEGNHYDPVRSASVRHGLRPAPVRGWDRHPIGPAGAPSTFFAQRLPPPEGRAPSTRASCSHHQREHHQTCSQAGEFMLASLKGSYDGEGMTSTPANPFRMGLIATYAPGASQASADPTSR